MTADDKRLFRTLEQQHADSALSRSNSVDNGTSPSSPFGDLGDHQTRKKLVHLIATLNASYPDYDFSSAKAESFTWKTGAEYMHMVKNSIMTTLAEADTSLGSSVNLCEQLWQQIESEISPSECDIFSYIPDMDCDPLSDGKMCDALGCPRRGAARLDALPCAALRGPRPSRTSAQLVFQLFLLQPSDEEGALLHMLMHTDLHLLWRRH